MFPDHLPTDPATVLDLANDGPRWIPALRDSAIDTRGDLVRALREGPARFDPDAGTVALDRRWFDSEVGYQNGHHLDPDAVSDGRYCGVYGVEHTFEDGVDWFHDATAAQAEVDHSPEWQWQLNRHYQWVPLADAYAETGEERYAQQWERELRSWVEQCPRPSDHDGNTFPSAWRTIEAGIRAGVTWPYAFDTFRESDAVSDEAIWLFVCAFREHGEHLLRYPTDKNWKAMEANGLVHVGALVPELRGGATYLSTGLDRLVAEFERQFYPDGMQDELAPAYSGVSLKHAVGALQTADRLPATDATRIPQAVRERPGVIAAGYARLATPDGRCPPLHDSPAHDIRDLYRDQCGADRPWVPTGLGADLLPWGGYATLRREVPDSSGRYGLLDAGPYGTAHQHTDALQFLAFDDRWRAVDPGKPQYNDSAITDHLRSAAGHNVALLDGRHHDPVDPVYRATEPLPVAVGQDEPISATAATRRFENDAGVRFDHERAVVDTASGWLVYDRVDPTDDAAHEVEWLWHLPTADEDGRGDPDRIDVDDGAATVAHDSETTTRIEVAASRPTDCSVAAGETDPIRGWGPQGAAREPTQLPVVRQTSERSAGQLRAVTFLRPAGEATLEAARFDPDRTTVTLDAADPVTVSFRGVDLTEIGYEGPDGEAVVGLSEHRWP